MHLKQLETGAVSIAQWLLRQHYGVVMLNRPSLCGPRSAELVRMFPHIKHIHAQARTHTQTHTQMALNLLKKYCD